MKQFIFICLSFFAAQSVHAFEPKDDIFKNAPITMCEKSDSNNFQYDLKLKGNLKIGVISGVSTQQRLCGSPINVVGQYGVQDDGSYIVTLATLVPPAHPNTPEPCDAWVYQITLKGTSGDGEITFQNDQTESVHFELGACEN